MAVRTDFAAGEVLAAQDLDDTFAAKVNYALPVNAQTGSGASAYTFVLADALRLTTASNASAGTYTIPPQSSVVWLANSVIRIVNYGAGTVTIAGGAGVTVTNATTTLAQFESAALIRTASNAWTLVPFSGAGNANFSNAATGTYTDGGINYKYVTFTGSGTLTVTKAGLADVLVVGGGGGGGRNQAGGGGGGGMFYAIDQYLPAGTLSVVVGAGGAGGTDTGNARTGRAGGASSLSNVFAIGGGGGGSRDAGPAGAGGGSGGGAGGADGAGTAIGGASMIASQGFSGGANGNAIGAQGGSSAAIGTVSTAINAGASNSITGSPVAYASGGGGATAGTDGVSATNAGGGGGGGRVSVNGLAGTAGVVIVRVQV